MDAGKRWAEQQLKSGINVTPSSAEEAASQKFTHMGSRHLFWCAALDTALLVGEIDDRAQNHTSALSASNQYTPK
jgi:putative Ca2+/H+ antiporter (TMEM165/GDT1 family)